MGAKGMTLEVGSLYRLVGHPMWGDAISQKWGKEKEERKKTRILGNTNTWEDKRWQLGTLRLNDLGTEITTKTSDFMGGKEENIQEKINRNQQQIL